MTRRLVRFGIAVGGVLSLLFALALLRHPEVAAASQDLRRAADSSTAEQEDAPLQASLVLANLWLIDGTGKPAVQGAWIAIEGDLIVAVGRGTPPHSPGAVVLDLEGRTALPGLIDTHVHLRYLGQARWMLKLLLAHGATTVKDAGASSLTNLAEIRQWVEQEPAVPHLLLSGFALNGDSQELRFLADEGPLSDTLGELFAFGVDFIKVHNWVSSAALRRIVGFAAEHDLVVTGHIPLSMTSLAAIDAGIKILMHASTLRPSEVVDEPELVARYPMDLPYPLRWGYWAHFNGTSVNVQRTLDAWESRSDRFYFEPTLAVLEGMASIHDPEVRQNEYLMPLVSPTWRKAWLETPPGEQWGAKLSEEQISEAKAAVAGMAAFVGLAHRRGIRIVTGTDSAGGPPWVVAGDSLHRELELLVSGGLTPVEAIHAATGTAADALAKADRGLVAAGKRADLVIVRGNVSADISAIRDIEEVILGGVRYQRTQLLKEARQWAEANGADRN